MDADPSPITRFRGHYGFLSNFYMKPLAYNGELYTSAEHAYQSQKAWTIVDHQFIKSAYTPSEAKKRAHSITIVDSWEEIKVDVMKNVLRAKFAQEFRGRPNHLLRWLLETGQRELVEGNTWGDTYWGQCPLGNGENMLGKLLMLVRSESEHLR
jgi:ribA/ribD-fused uncharacterized protein